MSTIKIILTNILVLCTWTFAQAQDTQPAELSVVGCAGNYTESSSYRLHSSIGESFVSYGTSSTDKSLQSGFLQNFLTQTVGGCGLELEAIMAIDATNGLIWNELPSNAGYTLTLFHRNGHILHQEEYSRTSPFTGGDLHSGTYLYMISSQDDQPCVRSAVTIVK